MAQFVNLISIEESPSITNASTLLIKSWAVKD